MARTAEEIAALALKRAEANTKRRNDRRRLERKQGDLVRKTDGDLLKALNLSKDELAGLMDPKIRDRFQQLLPRKPQLVTSDEALAESSSEAAAD